MGYLYSKHLKRNFYIQDTTSNLGSNYHLIFDTFLRQPAIFFTEKRGLSLFVERAHHINEYIRGLSVTTICNEAKTVFQFRSDVLEKIQGCIRDLPQMDVGVQIRTGDKITSGEMNAIPLEAYANAILNAQGEATRVINVYLMTDNPDVLESLKGLTNTSIHYHMLPHPSFLKGGHDQKTYNALPLETKLESFYHFWAELYILQRVPRCICTFSSNIGRFLYMTSEFRDGIQSLDKKEFNLMEHMPRV